MEDSEYNKIQELINQICWADLKFFKENSRWIEKGKNKYLSLSFVLEENKELRVVQLTNLSSQFSMFGQYRYIPNMQIQNRVDKLIKPLITDKEYLFLSNTQKSKSRLFSKKFILEEPPSAHAVAEALFKMKKIISN